MLDQAALRSIALQFQVCPYHLSHELARWSDVVIGDYNYYFDAHASLYALTVSNQWRVAVLVDEAHNLPARARDMYSASLHPHAFRAAQRAAPGALKAVFTSVQKHLDPPLKIAN